ncbi:MAG: TRAP transporter large permease subunit [Hyphomicrobiaceae bacterium]|nr:TRAP transporter large permease subunit [Hyphomicrobiaceae bacterium]
MDARTDEVRDQAVAAFGERSRLARLGDAIDRALAWTTEVPAAVLVVVEAIVLMASVIARYVFHSPIFWADELAAMLFLWLAVLGSAIALRRGEHMRLTAFVSMLTPEMRAWCETFATVASLAFLVLICGAVFTHIEHERFIVMQALEISLVYRVGALGIGVVLMIASGLVRLLRHGRPSHIAGAVVVLCVVAAALWFGRPPLLAMGKWNLAVFFIGGVGVCILAGVPIAFAFAAATVAYVGTMTTAPLTVVVSRIDEGMSHLVLLSVPLFVWLGLLIEATGMARAMVNCLAALLGHVRGGLSYVLLGAMYLVSGISGSKAADMAAVAPVLVPEMRKRGEKPGELVSLLAASAAMSETIPPSLVLITIGSATGVSIAALFAGGLLPAFVLAIALAIVARWRYRGTGQDLPPRADRSVVVRTLWLASPALFLPFVIRAAVIEGVATATEVSTIGIAYTLLVGLVFYRELDWRQVYPGLVLTASLTGAILFIIGTATAMAWALTQSGFSRDLVAVMQAIPGGWIGFMAVSIVVFIVLGSLLEGIPAIVLFGPLLFPAARSLGIHDVHYAMVVVLAMGIGLFAPPLGVGYFTACAITKISPDEGMRPIWSYMLALVLGLIVVAFVPWISTALL